MPPPPAPKILRSGYHPPKSSRASRLLAEPRSRNPPLAEYSFTRHVLRPLGSTYAMSTGEPDTIQIAEKDDWQAGARMSDKTTNEFFERGFLGEGSAKYGVYVRSLGYCHQS